MGLFKKEGKPYEAVVFDMDGVIFDSEQEVMRCWMELARIHNLDHMEEVYYASLGTNKAKTKEIMQEAYGEDFPFEEINKEASVMYHEKNDGGNLPMKPGVTALLAFLKENGKKIALASSTRRQTVMSQLEWAQILPYFDVVICGDMVKKSKPDPEIFLMACEALDVAPEQAYAIEDSYNGIRAAHKGGLRPIMVPDMLPATVEMQELADAVLPDLDAVTEYLS